MKDGLSRLPHIKRMLRENTYAPLSRHIRFNHQEWQTQGGGGVECYSQSFSIIYFLREGARGKVSSKYWKKEYKAILPNYIKHLNDGYREALQEMREDLEETLTDLREADADVKMIEVIEARLKRMRLGDDERQEVWNRAMAESWGLIDEDEFEERWKEYVLKEL
jgi:predicted DNA-binding antitoxin AbrB/MazE fold protein